MLCATGSCFWAGQADLECGVWEKRTDDRSGVVIHSSYIPPNQEMRGSL